MTPKLSHLIAAAAALLALATGSAQARGIHWNVGIQAAPGITVGVGNGYGYGYGYGYGQGYYGAQVGAPAPVYVAPAPVYYAAPPVYAVPRYYVQPAPVYYAPPAYGYGPRHHYRGHRHGSRH